MHLYIRDKICECWVKLVSGVMTLNASLCIIPATDWQTAQDVPLLPHDSNWMRWGENNGQIQDLWWTLFTYALNAPVVRFSCFCPRQ